MVIEIETHPDRHMPMTEFEGGVPVESSVEEPQTTRTGEGKGPKYAFRGKNS